ncbi:Fasciclin domain-containing protein [Balamuthia mandrillaris]
MGKSVVVLLLFAAFLAVPCSSSDESTTINISFDGLIPGGSCEAEPCEECEDLGLTTFLLAAKVCGLNEQFTNPNNTFTIFAPRNEAFVRSFPDGLLRFLLESPEALTPLLLGHVVGAAFPTSAMVDGMTVPPLFKQPEVSFDLTFGVKVKMMDFSSANVISGDNFATNGVIHVTDDLLLFNLFSIEK